VRRVLITAAKVVFSIGLLAFLIHRAGWGEMAGVFRSARPPGLIAALLVYVATVVVISLRWQMLLVSQKAHVPFRRTLSLYFIGFFFNNFLPTSIGGDIYRAVGAGQATGRRAVCAASVLVERLMGMLAVATLAILAAVLLVRQAADGPIRALTLGFGALIVLLVALFFHRRTFHVLEALAGRISLWGLEKKLLRLSQALDLYRSQRAVLLAVFLASIAYQLLIVVFSYLVGRALGLGISFRYFMLCVPFTVIISLVPISINGVGIREGGYVFLLSKIGHSSSEAVSLSLLIYALSLLVSLIGGLLYLLRGIRTGGSAARREKDRTVAATGASSRNNGGS
jgi:uncharacterized protein (TIRG00374 family)